MDEGEAKEETGPERTCAVSGEKGPPEAMLRFALSGSGEVTPDIRRRLPGRGVWTRLDFATVRQAVAKQAFSRGFRVKAIAAGDLAETVDGLLERDALQFLSIVNKAGLIVAGATKVEAAVAAGKVIALSFGTSGNAPASFVSTTDLMNSPVGSAVSNAMSRGRTNEAPSAISTS